MVPSSSFELLPSRTTDAPAAADSTTAASFPASATGGLFSAGGAAFTVICTVSLAIAPLSSVTLNSKIYTPSTKSFTPVCALVGVMIDGCGCNGPDNFIHWKEVMVPSGSVDAVPFNVTVFVGKVMAWSEPASALDPWLGVGGVDTSLTIYCIGGQSEQHLYGR